MDQRANFRILSQRRPDGRNGIASSHGDLGYDRRLLRERVDRVAHNRFRMLASLILDRGLDTTPGNEFLLGDDDENLETALCLGGTACGKAKSNLGFFRFVNDHQIGAHLPVCLPPSALFR